MQTFQARSFNKSASSSLLVILKLIKNAVFGSWNIMYVVNAQLGYQLRHWVQRGAKKFKHVWISRLSTTHQPRAANVQPISPDGTCVTELSGNCSAQPCTCCRQENAMINATWESQSKEFDLTIDWFIRPRWWRRRGTWRLPSSSWRSSGTRTNCTWKSSGPAAEAEAKQT